MGDAYELPNTGKDDLSIQNTSHPSSVNDMYDKANGSSASLALFYPQLTGYELHPLLLSNHHSRHQNVGDLEVEDDDNSNNIMDNSHTIFSSSMMNEPMRQKYIDKHKSSKKRHDDPPPLPPDYNNCSGSEYSVNNRKTFYCRICEKAFKFQTSLLRHNNKVHISKYQCPTCHRVFSRQAYLDVHTSKQGSSCFLGNYANTKSRSKSSTK